MLENYTMVDKKSLNRLKSFHMRISFFENSVHWSFVPTLQLTLLKKSDDFVLAVCGINAECICRMQHWTDLLRVDVDNLSDHLSSAAGDTKRTLRSLR